MPAMGTANSVPTTPAYTSTTVSNSSLYLYSDPEENISKNQQQILPGERSNAWKRLQPSSVSLEPRLEPSGLNLSNWVKAPPSTINRVETPLTDSDNDVSPFPAREHRHDSHLLRNATGKDSNDDYAKKITVPILEPTVIYTVQADAAIQRSPIQVSIVPDKAKKSFQPDGDYRHVTSQSDSVIPVNVNNVVPSFTPQAVSNQTNILANIWPVSTDKARVEHPDFCKLYDAILAAARPNCIGARLQVHSALNLDEWDKLLINYHDKEICSFLRFGWPIGFHNSSPPSSVEDNHASAANHLKEVKEFIQTELGHGALVGPFSAPPFQPWSRCSPIMTRPKKETSERRVIVDLSFPIGFGVNDGIDTLSYFGRDVSYTLPSIKDFITVLQKEGRGALAWKADLARAYRQLRADPVDAPLLGIKVGQEYYIDRCPPFGCKTSSAACQRTSNALVYLMREAGYFLLAYLDDYISCNKDASKAAEAYTYFADLTSRLGLKLAAHKCVHPTMSIDWLGYTIDTKLMTVAVPLQKLREIIQECKAWETKNRVSKKMLQSIVGRIMYVSNCIRPARKFSARILATLRQMKDRNWTTIKDDVKADLKWFYNFAAISNGVYYYSPPRVEIPLECDSSLYAGGGVGVGRYYTLNYTDAHRQTYPSIVHLEAINLLVLYRTMADFISDPATLVVIYTDNLGLRYALETGKTKDGILASCAREMWLMAAAHNHQVTIRHKPGTDLVLADALSRQAKDPQKAALAKALVLRDSLINVTLKVNDYVFFNLSI